MKLIALLLAVAVLVSVGLTGCGKKEEPPPLAPPAATTVTEPAPAAAAKPAPATALDLVANAKTAVDRAMGLAKEGKYTEAISLLQQELAKVQNDPQAKKLVDDAIAQIQKMMTEAATKAATQKATEGATKAIGDMLKK